MSATAAAATAAKPAAIAEQRRLPPWWPLAALVLLAAALRLATLTEQSFWYDESFTPVHVLHPGLGATLKALVHSENTPPLWYLLAWIDVRLLGDGALALRLPSALAGIATVPLVWAIGSALSGRRAALIGAAIVAVNPLFVWYSQEARAYGLFVFFAALAMLCFVRLLRAPSGARAAWFALSGALALLTHYFAVFLLVPMVLLLLRERAARRAALPAAGALIIVGLALLPLISAQGGHGTQWIGRWALSSRLQAIPQYFLTGYSGSPLGHGVELLVALPIIAGVALGAWRLLGSAPGTAPEHRASSVPAPASARSAVVAQPPMPSAREGASIALAYCGLRRARANRPRRLRRGLPRAAQPRRGDGPRQRPARDPARGDRRPRRAVDRRCADGARARRLPDCLTRRRREPAPAARQLARSREAARSRSPSARDHDRRARRGAARVLPSQPRLHNLGRHTTVSVSEIDETGYSPLRHGAGRRPAAGFHLLERREIDGLIVYRFVSSVPRTVSEAALRRNVITLAHPEVLVPAGAVASRTPPKTG